MRRLTSFTIDHAGNLRIELTDAGREDWAEIVAEREAHGIDSAFLLLIEHQLCNGWEILTPEEIGALTSSIILAEEAERDEDGDLVSIGRIYWNPRYQVDDEIERMESDGFLVYESANATA